MGTGVREDSGQRREIQEMHNPPINDNPLRSDHGDNPAPTTNAAIARVCDLHQVMASLDVAAMSDEELAAFVEAAGLLTRRLFGLALCASAQQRERVQTRTQAQRVIQEYARCFGTSAHVARHSIESAKHPVVAKALSDGKVSFAHMAWVHRVHASDPDALPALFHNSDESISDESMGTFEDRARVLIDRHKDPVARWDAMRELRCFATWKDRDGLTSGRFRLLPDTAAVLASRLESLTNDACSQARTQGRVPNLAHCRADAFSCLLTSSPATTALGTQQSHQGKARAEVVVHLDGMQLRLDCTDRMTRATRHPEDYLVCDVPGFGSIPLSRVQDSFLETCLSVLITNGVDITTLARRSRTLPARVRDAVLLRDVHCQRPGCTSRLGLEVDHVTERSLGGSNSPSNLMLLWSHHHREKTFWGFHIEVHDTIRTWVSEKDCVCARRDFADARRDAGIGSRRIPCEKAPHTRACSHTYSHSRTQP